MSDPIIIGGIGGSGTTLVARMCQAAGVDLGRQLNNSLDALEFVEFFEKWTPGRLVEPDADFLHPEMQRDFAKCWSRHFDTVRQGVPWGWKNPRMVLWFDYRAIPDSASFIHVVRDGRDMAYSRNTQQAERYARLLTGEEWPEATPQRQAAYWNAVMLKVADYKLDRLLTIHYEALCVKPLVQALRLLEFLDLDADVNALAGLVKGGTIGRWRNKPVAAEVEAICRPGLEAMGYV